MPEVRIKTYMSPVYYRHGINLEPFVPPSGAEPPVGDPLCLLDDLLGGGIVLPPSVVDQINRPIAVRTNPGLFVLLVGAPGTGKSTFALELCWRLALKPNVGLCSQGIINPNRIGQNGISSLYFSAEASTGDIIHEASSYGWETENKIVPWKPANNVQADRVHILGRERVFLPGSQRVYGNAQIYFDTVKNAWNELQNVAPAPQVIVLDSLNILGSQINAEDTLEKLTQTCLCGPLMMIAILDEHWEKPGYDRWVHFADLVIELSHKEEEEYLVRRIQILKARFQDHADGRHQIKINPKPDAKGAVQHPMSPLIKEGGIFVFPSVHRVLSRARRLIKDRKPRLDKAIPTPFADLNKMISNDSNKGIPPGACTAIVGSRGGMKSHLAYYLMLKFLENPEETALLISLRDEDSPAQQTLQEILQNQRNEDENKSRLTDGKHMNPAQIVNKYIANDQLEILFFWPGYVAPEEFFHLIRVAIDRPRAGKKPPSLVIVNGLEQLSARFPLCARENMFVSGLITMFNASGITSVVVSGGDPSLPPDKGGVPAGLLQMADLIIESSFQILPQERVWSEEVWGREPEWERLLIEKRGMRTTSTHHEEPHVIYQIVREPGARECRRRALFYMGRKGDKDPLVEGSVVVKGLPDDFMYGDRL